MSLAEIIVVYLSTGAPFGVLVFLSRRSNSRLRSIVESSTAAIFWPVLAISWTYRRLLLKLKAVSVTYQRLNVPDLLQGAAITEYATLTRALHDAKSPNAEPSAELFQVAGHSNPDLAAVCSQRRRDSQLNRRQKASAEALIDHLRAQNTQDPIYVRSVAAYCQSLGDPRTAELIERISTGQLTQLPTIADPVTADPVRLAA